MCIIYRNYFLFMSIHNAFLIKSLSSITLQPLSQSEDSSTPHHIPNKTKLLYFEPSPNLECKAMVQSIKLEENAKDPNTYSIVVDQTVCHPQGGGQPFDTGFIYGSDSCVFQITDARIDRDTECIRHIGRFIKGRFEIGDEVQIKIDREKRLLYCRLHTAGHLIDAALHLIGYKWEPTKGYHFPNGPYVEYKGYLEQPEVESLKNKLKEKSTELIEKNVEIKIQLDISLDDAKRICGELDPMYESSPSLRLVSIGNYFTCPCGGTHVESLSQLKSITIPKIKLQKSKGIIQVRYDVER